MAAVAGPRVTSAPLASRLGGLFEHPDSARVLGRAYLRAFPAEATVAKLERALAAGVDGRLSAASDDELRALFALRARLDFAQEDTVVLDGWIVARTEGRLAALAALGDDAATRRGGRRADADRLRFRRPAPAHRAERRRGRPGVRRERVRCLPPARGGGRRRDRRTRPRRGKAQLRSGRARHRRRARGDAALPGRAGARGDPPPWRATSRTRLRDRYLTKVRDVDGIAQLRSFNRTVTARVGALEDSFLERGRPLGASRMLWEVGDGADVRELRARLGLDSGYLSRLLRGLEADGLVRVEADERDRRVRRSA